MKIGAGDGTRTRNPQLGKLMRYHCATPAQEGPKQKDGASKQNIAHHEQNVLGFQKIIKRRYCVNEDDLKGWHLMQE